MNRHKRIITRHLSRFFLLTLLCVIVYGGVPQVQLVNAHSGLTSLWEYSTAPNQVSLEFNGTEAFVYLEAQCDFGPRPPGSSNLTACGDYIISILEAYGWPVQTQTWTYLDTPLRNIVAGAIALPRYVLLAHYDTRPIAEMDPDPLNRTRPILGANDGASGVATLLELAAVLPPEAKNSVALLFVDAEDSGNVNGWEWIVGSTYYVNGLSTVQRLNIQAAILLDMMGDADLQLKREGYSTPSLANVIWQIATDLVYADVFLNVSGYSILDDHHPFLAVGISAVDIIDFDYPYWHTLADTPDKCAPESLEAVGRVVESFVEQQLINPTIFTPTQPLVIPYLELLLLVVGSAMIVGLLILFIFWQKKPKNDYQKIAGYCC
ncbi:MAG: M28 family peptidase [Candidatus Hodarchaeota archaeon]